MKYFNNFNELYSSNTNQNLSIFNYSGKENFLRDCTEIIEKVDGNEDYDADELWAMHVGSLIRREVKTLEDCKKVFEDFGDTKTLKSNDTEKIIGTANSYLYRLYEDYCDWFISGDSWNFRKTDRQHFGISTFDKRTKRYIATPEDEAIYERVGGKKRFGFDNTDWENEIDWDERKKEVEEEEKQEMIDSMNKMFRGEISIDEWMGLA